MAVTSVPISGANTIAGYNVTLPFTTTDSYTFSFPYLSQDDFAIVVNSETELESSDFTFTSDYLIQLTTTGVNTLNALYGSLTEVDVVIRRRTRLTNRLVDFQDGANVQESDLDLSANQLFYLIQEIYDTAEIGNAAFNPVSGAIDYGGVEIQNIDEPTTLSSAVTLNSLFNNVVTPDYTEGDTYRTGRLVFNGGDLYRANTDIDSAPAVFDAGDFALVIDASELAKIATLEASIATNASNISTNASAISVNTSAIASNTSAIATNATAISDNTGLINANTASIGALSSSISANTSNLTDHELENETAHTQRDTKSNLDTWASGATDGAMAYATDEQKPYIVKDGVLVEIAGAGGGSGDLSVFHQETFEETVAANTSTGNNASFLGGGTLDGTVSDETTNHISGTSSLKYVMGSSSTDDYVALPAVDLELKQKGNLVGVKFYGKYDGNDGDIDFLVRDVTNDTELVRVPIKTSSVARVHEGFFSTASDTSSLRYGFQVQTGNTGAELIIDDIEFKVSPLITTEIYNSSNWNDYTPTVSAGFGTATNVSGKWRQDGGDMILSVFFTVGTPAASLAYIELPSGYSIDANDLNIQSTTGTGSEVVGRLIESFAGPDRDANALVSSQTSTTRIYFGHLAGSSQDHTVPTNGSNMSAAGENVHILARVPIAGWSDKTNGVTVKSVETYDVVNTNEFSARISGTTITSQNLNFIQSVTNPSTGRYVITFVGGVFSVTPSISGSSFNNAGVRASGNLVLNSGLSKDGITIDIVDDQGTAFNPSEFTLFVNRQGTDYVRQSDRVYTVPVDSLTGNWVVGRGNASQTIGANTPIPFSEVSDTAGAWDGDEYIVQKSNSKISISGMVFATTSANRQVSLFVNGTLRDVYYANGPSVNTHPFTFMLNKGEVNEGDVLSITLDVSTTLINSPSFHYIKVNEEYGDRGIFLGTMPYNKFQTKTLSSDVTSSGDIASLQFNNLETGKTYRVSGQLYYQSYIFNEASLKFYSGASQTGSIYGAVSLSNGNGSFVATSTGFSYVFTAESNTLYTYGSVVSAGSGSTIFGNGTKSETFISIEELNGHRPTTDFT